MQGYVKDMNIAMESVAGIKLHYYYEPRDGNTTYANNNLEGTPAQSDRQYLSYSLSRLLHTRISEISKLELVSMGKLFESYLE